MKKLKLFSLLMLLFVGVTSMWAADPDPVKSTFTKATVPADNQVTDLEGVVTWDIATVVGAGDNPTISVAKNNGIECVKFGDKAALHFSKVTLSTDYYKNYNVTSVKLYVLNNGNKTGTLTVKQGTTTIGTDSKTFGTTWTELTANTNKGSGGTLEVIYEVAQASYWSYIEVTYEDPTAASTPKISYEATQTGGTLLLKHGEDNLASGDEVEAGEEVTIIATPGEGYKLPATISFKDGENQDVDPDDLTFIENDDKNGGAFLMPNYDLTVAASFTAKTQPTDEQFAWSAASASVEKGGEGNVFPSLTNTLSLDVTYESSETAVATIASDGTITLVAAGETQISAIFAGNGDYLSKTVKYTLTVTVDCENKVAVHKTAPVNGSFNVSAEEVCADGEGGFVIISDITPDAGYELNEVTVTVGTYDANTGKVTGITAETTIEVTFKELPKYTATWFVNGENIKSQNAVAGTALEIPAPPTTLAEDCADLKFRGWVTAPIASPLDEAPEYVTTEGLVMGDADANYYAVFATEKKEEIDGDIEWVATAFADLATNDVVVYANASYAMSNNNSTSNPPSAVAITAADGKLTAEPATTIQWTIEKDGTTIKFKKGTDYLYCTNTNNGVRVGSGDANVFSINTGYLYTSQTSDARYVGVYNNTDWRCYTSINNNIKDQVFTFYKKTVSKQEVTSYIDFRTTCPSCKTVTLLKADAEHGSFILKQNGVEVTAPVKTCDAAEITIEATPNPGCQFKFANISTLSGASISGTTITLEAGTEGELTVSASFAQNDYKVVLSQTGDAEAELTGATEAAHYGDKIDVSAPAVGGFHFIGWEASGVTLTDATALSQSFSMPANDVTLTAKYTKILTVAEAIAKINADGTSNDQVVEGYISQIDSYNSKYSSITYWIKDIDANGFLTGTAFEVYGGLGLNGAGFTSEDNIVVGAKVRVFGQIKYYETQSIYEFNSNNYQLAYDAGSYLGVDIYGEATETEYEVGDEFKFDGLSAKHAWSNGYAEAIASPIWAADPTIIAANTTSVSVTAKDDDNTSAPVEVDVTVLTHAVTFSNPENGKLSIMHGVDPVNSGDAFVKGTVLNIEVSPAIGYKLATLTVNGIDVKAEKQFEIGTESQYEVVATFSEKAEAGIAWSAAKATAVDYEGAVNTLPTLTNTASLEVAYESTNTDVAEIAANGDVTIKAAGTATIKAIFAGNETYKAATVTYELTVNHVPVVKLAGSFNDWTGALLTPNEDYTEASVKVNFAADSWPLFKMIVDEAWLGLPMDGENNYLFHRDWNAVAISDAGENIQLKADFEGEYTFTWTYATNTLTITFPDMPESEYYIAGGFTSWEDNMAKMMEDAGMYMATVTINATEAQEFKVVRVQGPYKTWYGLADKSTMTPENCTNWTIGGNENIGLQPSYAGKYTFYFNEGEMQLTIDMPTEPGTALDNTEAGEKAAKVMQNGQLLIIKNGKTFNAQGAVVK